MGKVEENKKTVQKPEEDTYGLSKKALRKEMDSIIDEITDLNRRVTLIGNDLEKVMGRLGL